MIVVQEYYIIANLDQFQKVLHNNVLNLKHLK